MRGKGFFDGLCEPVNPGGIATFGYVMVTELGKEQGFGLAAEPWTSDSTNNVAEYTGLICLLKRMLSLGVTEVEIFGDSQLVIRQLRGEYKVKSSRIEPLYTEARRLLEHFRSVKVEWIPREKNEEADSMTRKAYELAKRGELTKVGCQS
ncbi:hypothetical protein HS1genome_0334 [Sulfodiicoccus acidiphilus]|uniref:RNase H type-1 domain-containing protein n=1 Tax=Sulfodiicoccus acidiphilus TaxID=1670455 RepID=A0A348B193_9CREN|nr:ribonuclease HI [Sulfodiicoccus acidiphilus]BBD71945.1 hypothetical protein HS1genome_0334 [Sulfodiicoccus acidiphilus]GGT91657.1 hypothetical protein GCM10007116_06720 [Sulfodiicoccus acidiphilus]